MHESCQTPLAWKHAQFSFTETNLGVENCHPVTIQSTFCVGNPTASIPTWDNEALCLPHEGPLDLFLSSADFLRHFVRYRTRI